MNCNDIKAFGQLIKSRRKELGYTQKDVANVSGLSVSFISDVENGKETIEFAKTIRLANLLGLDVFANRRG